MKPVIVGTHSKLALLSVMASMAACTTGTIGNSSGTAIGGAEIIAYGHCGDLENQACAASEVETETPNGILTGFKTTTNDDGLYYYDPYAVMVPPGEAKAIAPIGGDTYKLQISKPGYRDIWLDFAPVLTKYHYQSEDYYVAQVPDMYLCLESEADTDGDGICDAAEAQYGTSPSMADSDSDGEYDDQEIFGSGTGSPFAVQSRKLIHFNVNVSDFDVSRGFYELLGFQVLLDTNVDVPDPDEAQGLDLPPYSLRAAPMALGGFGGDGFLIDLIRFESPYDPQPPHSGEALGMTTLHMQTENLPADMAALDANGTSYTLASGSLEEPLVIELTDPDGVLIELAQSAGPVNYSPDYQRTISGPTIYVSDHAQSLAFYRKIGFLVSDESEGASSIYLSNHRTAKLVETDSEIPAYEDLNHLGIARVAIETTNIDQDITILEAAGVEFFTSEAVVPSGPFSFLRYVCFEDPDGTVIELVEYNN